MIRFKIFMNYESDIKYHMSYKSKIKYNIWYLILDS